MSALSGNYVKNGDQVLIQTLSGLTTGNGFQMGGVNPMIPQTCSDNSSNTCFGYVAGQGVYFFIVKLEAVNLQKSSFQYSQSTDPYIRLGDVVGFVESNSSSSNGQLYTSLDVGNSNTLDVIIQDQSWINGSINDLHQVWLITDVSNMGYYNSGCDGIINPASYCAINPTCGLQPPTNIPVVYGQSYAVQNYGQMVDQTVGGNNYSQWFYDTGPKQLRSTNINKGSDKKSKPSENAFQGSLVSFAACPFSTSCPNYFDYFDINVTPLPQDSDPVDNKGTEWWVYTLIILGLILFIIIIIVIFIVERKK